MVLGCGCSSVIKHLPSIPKVLGWNPKTEKKSVTEKVEQGKRMKSMRSILLRKYDLGKDLKEVRGLSMFEAEQTTRTMVLTKNI
jgi:hypothetical protein